MAFENLHRPLGAAGLRGAIGWVIIISGSVLFLQQFAGRWLVPPDAARLATRRFGTASDARVRSCTS